MITENDVNESDMRLYNAMMSIAKKHISKREIHPADDEPEPYMLVDFAHDLIIELDLYITKVLYNNPGSVLLNRETKDAYVSEWQIIDENKNVLDRCNSFIEWIAKENEE